MKEVHPAKVTPRSAAQDALFLAPYPSPETVAQREQREDPSSSAADAIGRGELTSDLALERECLSGPSCRNHGPAGPRFCSSLLRHR